MDDDLPAGEADYERCPEQWAQLQVALSIQAGKISSATLLRKLGTYSRKNRLYLAAREVGPGDPHHLSAGVPLGFAAAPADSPPAPTRWKATTASPSSCSSAAKG